MDTDLRALSLAWLGLPLGLSEAGVAGEASADAAGSDGFGLCWRGAAPRGCSAELFDCAGRCGGLERESRPGVLVGWTLTTGAEGLRLCLGPMKDDGDDGGRLCGL